MGILSCAELVILYRMTDFGSLFKFLQFPALKPLFETFHNFYMTQLFNAQWEPSIELVHN